MKARLPKPVAGGRLASSPQPPRATPVFTLLLCSRRTPQPLPWASFLDNPGALLEGLRCFTAFRPLSHHAEEQRKTQALFAEFETE